MATMAVSLSTGLYATHVLVPPTPGPIAAAGNLHADLGMVILLGLIVAVPTALSGWFYASKFACNIPAENFDASDLPQEDFGAGKKLPTPAQAFAPIILPILLIGLRSVFLFPGVIATLGKENLLTKVFNFIGDPVVALFIGLLLCIPLVPKLNEDVMTNWVGDGIKDAGAIIVITAAGGSLGAIIATTKIGAYLGNSLAEYNLGIFLPFIISAALKTAQGSSTVALITASTIVYPLLGNLGLATPMGAVLTTLSVGCGSMVVSHSNDSYFWVVSQFSGLKVDAAYKSHTVATLIQGIVGIAVVWLLVKILI
jgi:GntP family gluconate:H+ symporter